MVDTGRPAGRRTGTAELPLHGGRAPRWLFERMVRLARALILVVVDAEGNEGFLRRASDPFWFQAFGCALGFDWHSSGLTTTVGGAVKEALRQVGPDLGLYAAGGKGAVARRTPAEVEAAAERSGFDPAPLVRASRLAAKVDTAAVQDGYDLYYHLLLFDGRGRWCVVQQGMNDATAYARRYHWLGEAVTSFVEEPHAAVCCDARGTVLNMVAAESGPAREAVAALGREQPERVLADLVRLQADARAAVRPEPAAPPADGGPGGTPVLRLPARHHVSLADVDPRRLANVLVTTYERQPGDFQALLETPGVGPATVRALALLAELACGAPASTRDPARFSFAHGGKDGHPYPVNRARYDASIAFLEDALTRARVGDRDKVEAFRRLARLAGAAR